MKKYQFLFIGVCAVNSVHAMIDSNEIVAIERGLHLLSQDLGHMAPEVFETDVAPEWHQRIRFLMRYIGKDFKPEDIGQNSVTFTDSDSSNKRAVYTLTYPQITYLLNEISCAVQKALMPPLHGRDGKTELKKEYILVLKHVHQFNLSNPAYKSLWELGKWKHIRVALRVK